MLKFVAGYHSNACVIRCGGKKSNYEVNKALNKLFNENRKKNKDTNKNEHIADTAMNLYNEIDEVRNYFVINTLCKILFHFKQTSRALLIWDDIDKLLRNTHDDDNGVSHSLLINIYAECSFNKSLQIFESIASNKIDIKIINSMMQTYVINHYNDSALQLYDSISIQKDHFCHIVALKACRNIGDIQKGQQIHDLLHSQSILNDHNVAVLELKTAFIGFYGDLFHIQHALDVFHSVTDAFKDIQFINAMMKAHINNNENNKALELYYEYNLQHMKQNKQCHILAIRACKNTANYEKGVEIHNALSISFNDSDILIQNALIDFYGTLNDINSSLEVFNSMHAYKKDIVSINSMMNCFIKHNQNNA